MNFDDQQKKALTMVIIFGAIGLFLVGYYWFMFGKSTLTKNEKQKEVYQKELETVERKLKEINSFEQMTKDEYDVLRAKLERMKKRLPETRDAPGFLNQLSDILRRTGIYSQSLSAQDPKEYAKYTEIPYMIKGTGRFHEFGYFLNLVEENERFMRVRTMKIENDESRPTLHPVEVDIATFMLEEQ